MALPQGPCHLCGKQKVLTYEHVPASSSYNNKPVEMFGFEHWLKRTPSGEMSGGELKDRGAGVHTLCADCSEPYRESRRASYVSQATAACS